MLKARISYKQTPFFVVDSGDSMVNPKILNHQEYEDIMNNLKVQ